MNGAHPARAVLIQGGADHGLEAADVVLEGGLVEGAVDERPLAVRRAVERRERAGGDQDDSARPERMPNPERVPDLRRVEGEIGRDDIREEERLERVRADRALAKVQLDPQGAEASPLEGRRDQFLIYRDGVDAPALLSRGRQGDEGEGTGGHKAFFYQPDPG